MTKRNRSLPSPPGRRFGPTENRPEEGSDGLLEEKLAQAAAMGKLDEFMDEHFKDNEHARRLASMMMGMTGMAPAVSSAGARTDHGKKAPTDKSAGPPPEDIVDAAREGNVGELMGLLAREHEKRSGTKKGHETQSPQLKESTKQPLEKDAGAEDSTTSFDRETLDALVSMAGENKVSIDWLISRAIKLYIRDYKSTGRM